MPKVLLYNVSGSEKYPRIRTALMMLGIHGEEISPERFSVSIGALCGMDGFSPDAADSSESPFRDEMMVMQGLSPLQFNKLLDTMKRNRCSILLKAVVTDTNASWTSFQLHKELSAEYEAIRTSGSGKPKASVHRKK